MNMPCEMLVATNTFRYLGFYVFVLKQGLNKKQFPTCEPPYVYCIFDYLAPHRAYPALL